MELVWCEGELGVRTEKSMQCTASFFTSNQFEVFFKKIFKIIIIIIIVKIEISFSLNLAGSFLSSLVERYLI